MNFFQKQLYPNQYGFQNKIFTTHAMLDVVMVAYYKMQHNFSKALRIGYISLN